MTYIKTLFREMRKQADEVIAKMAANPAHYTWEGTSIQDHLTPEQWKAIDAEMTHQLQIGHDRGVAIVFCALVEDRLKWLMELQFRPDLSNGQRNFFFKGAGPLSSAYAQTKFLQALGMIGDDLAQAIFLIAEIRNKFAHTAGAIKFSDEKLAQKVERLRTVIEQPAQKTPLETYGYVCFVVMVALLTAGQRPRRVSVPSPETPA